MKGGLFMDKKKLGKFGIMALFAAIGGVCSGFGERGAEKLYERHTADDNTIDIDSLDEISDGTNDVEIIEEETKED